MKKIVFAVFISMLLVIGCTKEKYEATRPEWMQEMIDTIDTNDYYLGSKIYKHEWKTDVYYHLEIPFSSCFGCSIFHEDGTGVDWSKENMEDYFENRKRQRVVWRQ